MTFSFLKEYFSKHDKLQPDDFTINLVKSETEQKTLD